VGAELRGEVEAMLVEFNGDNLVGAGVDGCLDGTQADPACR
jgi:hypothetical protein